jgi:hypothetical protein
MEWTSAPAQLRLTALNRREKPIRQGARNARLGKSNKPSTLLLSADTQRIERPHQIVES